MEIKHIQTNKLHLTLFLNYGYIRLYKHTFKHSKSVQLDFLLFIKQFYLINNINFHTLKNTSHKNEVFSLFIFSLNPAYKSDIDYVRLALPDTTPDHFAASVDQWKDQDPLFGQCLYWL